MEWLQVFMIAGSTIGACYWMHREMQQEIREIRGEMKDFQKSVTDFHGRLCALEEKYIQMMQRFLERKGNE